MILLVISEKEKFYCVVWNNLVGMSFLWDFILINKKDKI